MLLWSGTDLAKQTCNEAPLQLGQKLVGEFDDRDDLFSTPWLSDPRIDVSIKNHAGETVLDQTIKSTETLPPEAGMWIYSVISQIGAHPSATTEMRERAAGVLRGWKRKIKRCTRELVNRCSGEVPKNHEAQTARLVSAC